MPTSLLHRSPSWAPFDFAQGKLLAFGTFTKQKDLTLFRIRSFNSAPPPGLEPGTP